MPTLPLVMEQQQESDWPRDYQAQFWNLYPRRVGKAAAMRKLDAIKRSGKVRWFTIVAALNAYVQATASKEIQFIAHPATWLNAGRWDDDPAGNRNSTPAPRNGFMAALVDGRR